MIEDEDEVVVIVLFWGEEDIFVGSFDEYFFGLVLVLENVDIDEDFERWCLFVVYFMRLSSF